MERACPGRGSKRNGITSRPATGLAPLGQALAAPRGRCGPRGRGLGRPDGDRRATRGRRCHRRPLRRDPGGGAWHRASGELRYRRAGRGLQRHVGQRLRQQLPLRWRRPGGHRGHAGHRRGRRRVRHGLDHTRAVVQLHRQRRHRGHLHRCLPAVLAVRDHRCAAHHQQLRRQPDRPGRRPEHGRVRDLDHGRRQHHPASRRADAHRRPGLQRLELPLHDLHPELGEWRRQWRRRQRRPAFRRDAGGRAGHGPGGQL
jgi:hypothetical protein